MIYDITVWEPVVVQYSARGHMCGSCFLVSVQIKFASGLPLFNPVCPVGGLIQSQVWPGLDVEALMWPRSLCAGGGGVYYSRFLLSYRALQLNSHQYGLL